MSRIEAAAKALFQHDNRHAPSLTLENAQDHLCDDYLAGQTAALAAADAHDAAHGVHRLVIDSATVERVSEVLLAGRAVCECKRSPFDRHDVNPPCSTRTWARQTARAVLAAAVGAGQ